MTKRQGQATGSRGDVADDAARARARRNAWLLGGLALAFYFGYMLLIVVRGAGGP